MDGSTSDAVLINCSPPATVFGVDLNKKTGPARSLNLVGPVFWHAKGPAAEAAGPKKERGLGVSRLGTILAPSGQTLVIGDAAGDGPSYIVEIPQQQEGVVAVDEADFDERSRHRCAA